jgi:hypothetical protein
VVPAIVKLAGASRALADRGGIDRRADHGRLTDRLLAVDLLLEAPLVELALKILGLAVGLSPHLELLEAPLDLLAIQRPRQPLSAGGPGETEDQGQADQRAHA